ncbi:MAG TPA: hypothetical protein PK285_11530 [Bacteroidales bacterium]|nr:hypothetical protein [Bacteroidales bacterium]
MKKVILKQLCLRNFRGIKNLELNFSDRENFIFGDNGLGKSTVFDAYCWLLFGKDAQDRKDYNIRPIINGELLRRVDCEVSAILDIDGSETELKRVFKEKWVKPRGEIEEVFKGNETETFWNNVPINVSEYQKKINEIIDEVIFKMLSIVHFFPTLDWKVQREFLFQMAGTLSDAEIAQGNEDFTKLIDKISGKSLSDFKKEISAQKRKLKENIAQIQPRIDQTQKLIPEKIDFSQVEKEIDVLKQKVNDIDNAISNKAEALRQRFEEIKHKQEYINELKQEQQNILFNAELKEREKTFELEKQRQIVENSIKALQKSCEDDQFNLKSFNSKLSDYKIRLQTRKNEIIALRKEWVDENAKEYDGSDTCPVCGQNMPKEMMENSIKLFTEAKMKKLSEISQRGKGIDAEIKELENEIENIQIKIYSLTEDILEKEKEIADLKDHLALIPVITKIQVLQDEIPEYKELQEKIEQAESGIKQISEDPDVADLKNKKIEFLNHIRELEIRLHDRYLIHAYENEIKELEKRGKELAQQLADIEKEEYIIQQFTKKKIDECEKRINSLFSIVKFKLFDYTIDGNEIETCIPLVNGIPYGVANNAGQVNAGLDIIKTLQRFYGIQLPIFCDGAESVNHYIEMDCQMIFLKVTLDKTLTLKN